MPMPIDSSEAMPTICRCWTTRYWTSLRYDQIDSTKLFACTASLASAASTNTASPTERRVMNGRVMTRFSGVQRMAHLVHRDAGTRGNRRCRLAGQMAADRGQAHQALQPSFAIGARQPGHIEAQ